MDSETTATPKLGAYVEGSTARLSDTGLYTKHTKAKRSMLFNGAASKSSAAGQIFGHGRRLLSAGTSDVLIVKETSSRKITDVKEAVALKSAEGFY